MSRYVSENAAKESDWMKISICFKKQELMRMMILTSSTYLRPSKSLRRAFLQWYKTTNNLLKKVKISIGGILKLMHLMMLQLRPTCL
jgi:hypothetical protein